MIHDGKPELDAYILEHYGVKGMRWGQRKTYTPAERSARRKKTAKRVAIGAGAAVATAGTAYVALTLSRSGNSPVRSAQATSAVAANAAKFIANSGANISASQLAQYTAMFEGV